MKTSTLFTVFVFLVGLSLTGSYFDIQGLDDDIPSTTDLASGSPTAYVGLVEALIPSPTGVLWFDLIIFAGLTMILTVGGYRIANPLGG